MNFEHSIAWFMANQPTHHDRTPMVIKHCIPLSKAILNLSFLGGLTGHDGSTQDHAS